jgi:hypothetical protein
LYDAGYESEAEQLSEWEMDSDDTIMCKIGGYYYAPDNSRGIDGKHTIRLFGLVNLESPYHRSGNLEDRIDIDITFNSIEELKEKLDLEISEITNWFDGGKYDESRERLKIVRMAKGGQISKIVKEGNELMGYEPYFEKNVAIASIDDSKKVVRPNHVYYPNHPLSKKAIAWAKRNGYQYIADGKKYAQGGTTKRIKRMGC